MNKFNLSFFNYLKYFYNFSYQNLHKTDKNYNFFFAVTAIAIPDNDSVTFVLLAVTVSIFTYWVIKPLFTSTWHEIPAEIPTGFPNQKTLEIPYVLEELPSKPRKIYEYALNDYTSGYDVFGNNLDIFNMDLFEQSLQFVCMTLDWNYNILPNGWINYIIWLAPPEILNNVIFKSFFANAFPSTFKYNVPPWFYLSFPNSSNILFIPTKMVFQSICSSSPDKIFAILSNTTDPKGFVYFYDIILNQASELLKLQPNNEYNNLVLDEAGKVILKNNYSYYSMLIWALFVTTSVIVHASS